MNKDRERVAIYVPTLGGGGAERVMAAIASGLSKLDFDVDLLLMQKKGPYIDELEPKVNIVDFNKKRMLYTVFSLIRYIRDKKPDVVLSAMSHTNLVTLAAVLVSCRRVRVIVSERGSLLSTIVGKRVSLLHRLLIRVLYPRADAIVAVSEGVRRELRDYFGISRKLVQTIYNPVNIEKTKTRTNTRNGSPHAWQDGAYQVFIAVGRLVPVKDYENLLKAFSIVASGNPAARMLILGEGPLYQSLLKLTQDLGISTAVDFVGFQPNPHAWFAASDVYVLSSRSEGLPNAMIQAMGWGLKVVSTDCNHGPSEILEDGRWGRLVPVGEPHALAEAMSLALLDPAPQDGFGRMERFSFHTILDQFLDVLALKNPNKNGHKD